ncbi:MAG TPA: ATP-binding protein [Longimicrobium sp.]|uniref:ATP-binding protein n=1 Tax=Longimicrobium sp. TaxID=2029185 RepID=UPI002ED8CA22
MDAPAPDDRARGFALADGGLPVAAAEDAFGRLARLAAALVRAPAAFVSLVDDADGFSLSCAGFPDRPALEREIRGPAFRRLAEQAAGPLVVSDSGAAPEYAGLLSPGPTRACAYICVPLRGEHGAVLGTFCVLDSAPRGWTAMEVDTVVELARSAEREMELRRRVRQVEEQGEEMQAQAAELEAQVEEAQEAAEMLEQSNHALRAARAESELERGQLRGVFEQAPVAVAVVRGPEHVFESANPGYLRLVGGRPVVGMRVADALPEVVEQGFITLLDGVLQTGTPFIGNAIPITLQDGPGGELEDRFLDFIYHPLRDAGEAITGIVAIATDVTAQVQAAAHRDRERARLARMVAQFPGAVAVLEGPEHRFVAASEQYRAQAGGREMVGLAFREVYPDLDGQGYYELLDGVYTTGQPWTGTGVVAAWDGDGDGVPEEHLLDIVYAPVRDAEGRVEGVATLYTVVDERERAAEALRQSQERYHLAARATADVIWDWDLAADCIRWNAALGERFGYHPPSNATSGAWWMDHVHPDDRDEVSRGIYAAIALGHESWSADYRFLRADGGYADVMDRGHIAQHEGGAATRMVGAMQDVTAQKAAEQIRLELYDQAGRARAEADHANRAKSQFLAQMSHEIRTPINAVIGYIDLLQAGVAGDLNPRQTDYIARVKASGQHLLGLVSDILDLSKAEAGEMEVAHEPTLLLGTASAALGMVAPLAQGKGVQLHDESLSACNETYVGDEDRVRQIAVNLLSNAVRFTDSGGQVTIRCGVRTAPPAGSALQGAGPWVVVEVEDTGRGIPATELERIFDPFSQVEGGHTRSTGGTGLGLTISRRFARLMGGDLTVRSALGEGSCFGLWLPTPEGIREMVEAEGRADESAAAEPPAVESWYSEWAGISGLAEIGHLIARGADPLTRRFGDRLRTDPALPHARTMDRAQLEDHVATFLLETGKTLITLDEGRGDPELMQDGASIQRVICERHGEQRRRIGWTADHLRREFVLLRAEVTALAESEGRASGDLSAALAVLYRLLDRAEARALRAFGA